MAATQSKPKSYAAFGILAAIIGLAYWHPSVARIIPPANVTLAQNTALTLRLDQNISSLAEKLGLGNRYSTALPQDNLR
jgi:hypothetical protein